MLRCKNLIKENNRSVILSMPTQQIGYYSGHGPSSIISVLGPLVNLKTEGLKMDLEELVLELRCVVLAMGLAYDEFALGSDSPRLELLDPDRSCGDLLMSNAMDRLVDICQRLDDFSKGVKL